MAKINKLLQDPDVTVMSGKDRWRRWVSSCCCQKDCANWADVTVIHKLLITQPDLVYLDALTDHASRDNHVINWPDLAGINNLRQGIWQDTRWIKEAVRIWKDGRRSVNWDEGSYTLSHTYDQFLATSHHYRGKNRKKNWTGFFCCVMLWVIYI